MADTSELDVSVNSPRATSTTSEPQISASDAAETLKGEGNAALKAGDLQTALEKYSSAISLDPTNSTYFSNRSVTYHKLGQYEAALEDAETAIELKPGWWKAHSRKISALHSLKQYEQALEWCDKAEATVSDKDAMKNFLKRTRKNTRRAAFSKRLRGKWHGKMTDPMFGDTMQIFEWLDSKTVKVMIIGQQLTCSYKIRTDLDQIDGGWRMDITVPNQPDVPYIFRFEGDELLLVAPQMDMQKGFAVPDGFGEKATGLVHLTKGEPPVDLNVDTMSREDKILDAIEQLTSSFNVKLPEQNAAVTEKEKMMQGLQVMQIMSVKVQNKYGAEIFQAAEKMTENPDLAGDNAALKAAATNLKAKITEVQKAMGTHVPGSNPAVTSSAASTASSEPKDVLEAEVKSVDVEKEVFSASADDRLADFEHFNKVEEELKQEASQEKTQSNADDKVVGETSDAAAETVVAVETSETPTRKSKKKKRKSTSGAVSEEPAGRRSGRGAWIALALAAVGVGVAVTIANRNKRK